MSIKKILFGTSVMLVTVFSLNSCCEHGDENTDVVADTVQKTEIIKKIREELIINRDTITISDYNNVTDFENKHTPDITFGEKDEKGYVVINVLVGSAGIVHPSVEEHWIDFMTLFINGEQYKHIEIQNGEGSNKQDFFAPLKNGDVVKIVLGCNIHGIWESSVHYE